MTDEPTAGPWTLDPDLRAQLRLERVRTAIRNAEWLEAVLEAEELLDDETEHPEALALLGHAALGLGDAQIARLALEQAVTLGSDDAASLLDLAVARFETCDLVGASEAAREVVRLEPDNAEGHWYLGLALERMRGRQAEAVTELSAARQLAPDRYPWPLDLDVEAWETAIRDAVGLLPPEIEEFWTGIPIQLVEEPDLDELRRMDPPVSPAVSGLFVGELPSNGDPLDARPEALRLFRRNLALSRSVDELIEHIADALESEALGWLGVTSVDELS